MHKLLIIPALLFVLISTSQAAVKFNCYALNLPAQAFEAGRANCGSQERKDLKKDTTTTVTCLYQSICEVLAPGEKPTVLTPSDVNKYTTDMMTGKLQNPVFKVSAITCRGEGTYKEGLLMQASCKVPKECQDDVLFNMGYTLNVGPYENTVVDSAGINKATGTNK